MIWLLLLLCLLPLSVSAQEVRLLPCGTVAFFAPGCPLPAPASVAPPPAPAPEAFPLFTPSLMAPDTPPIFLRLLEDVTEENALAFLAWQEERQARIQEVQQLIKRLTTVPTP